MSRAHSRTRPSLSRTQRDEALHVSAARTRASEDLHARPCTGARDARQRTYAHARSGTQRLDSSTQ
eukprot:5526559-Pleurochrysis_carterae.AAC.1